MEGKENNSSMFAAIRFIDDGVVCVVNLTDFKKKVCPSEINFNKLYKVAYENYYYKANVLKIGDSEDDLSRFLKEKRVRYAPISQLDDASSTDCSVRKEKEMKIKSKSISQKGADENKKKQVNENFRQILSEINNNVGEDSEVHALKLKLATLEEQLKNCKEQLKKYEEQEKKQEKKIEELERLNTMYQEHVIDYFKNFESQKEKQVECNEIGSRLGGNIHLGRGVWLPTQIFDAYDNTSTTSKFIKGIAEAVFGSNVLANSSVCGMQCNRTKDTPKPALDATKLGAIKDICRYRLIKRGMPEDSVEAELKLINGIISAKISDLSRKRKIPKIREDARNGEDTRNREVTKNKADTRKQNVREIVEEINTEVKELTKEFPELVNDFLSDDIIEDSE